MILTSNPSRLYAVVGYDDHLKPDQELGSNRACVSMQRARLDCGDTQKTVVAATGFRSAAHMSLAFERRFGLRPAVMRQLHAGAAR